MVAASLRPRQGAPHQCCQQCQRMHETQLWSQCRCHTRPWRRGAWRCGKSLIAAAGEGEGGHAVTASPTVTCIRFEKRCARDRHGRVSADRVMCHPWRCGVANSIMIGRWLTGPRRVDFQSSSRAAATPAVACPNMTRMIAGTVGGYRDITGRALQCRGSLLSAVGASDVQACNLNRSSPIIAVGATGVHRARNGFKFPAP